MSHGHGHGISPAEAATSNSGKHVNKLWIAAGLGLVTFVLQVTVGLFTSSLALLSDSAHVFTDIFGIFMALAAILVAQRAARRPDRTFGMYRTEVFAALANAILLFAVAGWVLYEAASRFTDPPEVPGLPVATVAVVGLAMNVIAFLMLRSGAKESINIRGAYLEVMADMVGSIGVLVSGLVTLAFGWRYADPVIGVAIGLFVLPRAFNLGRHAVRILLQQAPDRIDVTSIIEKINALPGVVDAHDLHVWTLTSGMEVASVHVTAVSDADPTTVLAATRTLLAEEFELGHATVQVELQGSDGKCAELAW
ncbi:MULTISPECIES: cation diffusion facilitator family transporter [Rhodococcus]|jgi:cobalt-zinc-cadmium efflux system protein|uniref:cation diffusion facilitator family transporter n=1 Tax=Rhodococcus TaxID=1827 RepID=UPI0006D2BA0F|nr:MULTISPECIES: cation diffusion facilitator family transporter [Rhodococcus]NHE64957.1 cation transporter [Rhodococcus sp. D-46]KSU73540.1 cation transporter [Rhodococcus qingshengii]KZF14393.1 cation transporter [Rhodococcus sp. EPR-134]MBP1051087.1 cation transporter [Rhodococcus qingshengii]MBQ7806764.1 cation transporter [Rhodococcus sp. (in: high G+C Gram-positive bacteria)]